MPDDDLHFSRSGTSHFGKLTAEVKTRLSEDEKADLMRASHIVGMSESEFVREIIRIRLYGLEHVQRIAAARLEAAEIAVCRKGDGSASGFKYFCGVCWSKIREADSGPR